MGMDRNMQIGVAAGGAGLILLLVALSCFCYASRSGPKLPPDGTVRLSKRDVAMKDWHHTDAPRPSSQFVDKNPIFEDVWE
jgi:hypothetical protein